MPRYKLVIGFDTDQEPLELLLALSLLLASFRIEYGDVEADLTDESTPVQVD